MFRDSIPMEVTLDLVLVETEEGAREKGTSSREHTHGKGRGAGEFAGGPQGRKAGGDCICAQREGQGEGQGKRL